MSSPSNTDDSPDQESRFVEVLSDAPPSTTVDADRYCLVCGYSLRGLDWSGVCPECGAAVDRSLRGDPLRNADPTYLKRLRLGSRMLMLPVYCVLAGFPLALGAGIADSSLSGPVSELVVMTLYWVLMAGTIACAILWPIAWTLATSGEPGVERRGWLSVFLVRAGAAVMTFGYLLSVLAVTIDAIGPVVHDASMVLVGAGFVLYYYPSVMVLLGITARAPGFRDVGRLTWFILCAGPVVVALIVANVAGLTPEFGGAVNGLVWMTAFAWAIWYASLLDNVRRAVRIEYALAIKRNAYPASSGSASGA